jgi:catechol 2,3-dioxygenase-like lactoylglutathione lyase family enzyme
MILGVWHFSFTVSDLDRSVDFYQRVLGLELVHRQDQANEYTRLLVGYSDADLRVAQLAVPGQPRGISTHDLELVEYVTPRGQRGTAEICNPGEGHLAIAVTDIFAAHERMVAAGVHFFSPPNSITTGVNAGGYACYLHDPDQIVLELLQPPAHRIAAVTRDPSIGAATQPAAVAPVRANAVPR